VIAANTTGGGVIGKASGGVADRPAPSLPGPCAARTRAARNSSAP